VSGAAIVVAVTVVSGRCTVKPPAVGRNAIGNGYTGTGFSENARLEYQRLVGGVTPSARWGMAAVDSSSTGSAAAASVMSGSVALALALALALAHELVAGAI
jgi:hypothetical protein